MLALLFIK